MNDGPPATGEATPRVAQGSSPDVRRLPPRIDPTHVVDLFVYVVVLNLAVEYVPSLITESFTASLLTALLLKLTLEVVLAVKRRVVRRLKGATTALGKVGGVLLLWLVLIGSKFAVLTLEDLLLGDRVDLGGFFSVTGLIVVLMLSRAGVRWLLDRRLPSVGSARQS